MKERFDDPAAPASSVSLEVTMVEGTAAERRRDRVTTEEPLEIRLVHEVEGRQKVSSIAVTMRTPGDDFELATGFLVSEGVVRAGDDIWRVGYCEETPHAAAHNVVEVHLHPRISVDLNQLSRHLITSSSCGICGKTSIEAVDALHPSSPRGDFQVDAEILIDLPEILASRQPVFAQTGGIHAAALFDQRGRLLVRREDVGRHNAVDKLVGSLLKTGELPAGNRILLLSGRISFELVQKALLAGVPIVAAVGAPSSLAITLAESHGMTLVGFLRQGRFNIYCGRERIVFPHP